MWLRMYRHMAISILDGRSRTALSGGGGGSYCDSAEVAASSGAEVNAHVMRALIVIVRVAFAGACVAGQRHACLRALLQGISVHIQVARLSKRREGQDNNKRNSKQHLAQKM